MPQLQHIPQHSNGTLSLVSSNLLQCSKGGFHGHRAGIIGIVDDIIVTHTPVFKAHAGHLQALQPFGNLLCRQPQHIACCHSRQCIRHIMPAQHRDGKLYLLPLPADAALESSPALMADNIRCLDIRITIHAEGHNPDAVLCLVLHGSGIRIVVVQNHRATGRNVLHQLPLGLCYILNRAQKLHMGFSHVGHNTNLRGR